MIRDMLWGIRQIIGPAVLGLVLGSILLALRGTSIARQMGVPGWRLALGYCVGLTIAGSILGLGRYRIRKKWGARLVASLAVFGMLLSIFEIALFDWPGLSQLLVVGLTAVVSPLSAIPLADSLWKEHFEKHS